jgi:hypothetical protein
MKSLKQIREHRELIIEREEAEERKLTSLVRAGLFDSKKLPALKRALDKSADKISGQEKRMLITLLDSLIDQVLSNQSVYQKVKQNVMKEEYLDEGRLDPTTRDINDLPNIIMLRRRAIRSFPGGGKVVMYWADKINRYIPIPVDPVNTITRGPNIDGLNEAKAFSSMSDDEQDELVKSTRKMNPVLPAKKKKLMVRTKLGKQTQAQRLERIKKGRQYQAAIKFGGEQGYGSQAYQFAKGGQKAAALGTLVGGGIGSLVRHLAKEGLETTRIKMKKMTVSPLTGVRKNEVLREEFKDNIKIQRELDESALTAIGGAAYRVGGAALKYGSKYADDTIKGIGNAIKDFKVGRAAATAEKEAAAAAKIAKKEKQLAKIDKFRSRNKDAFAKRNKIARNKNVLKGKGNKPGLLRRMASNLSKIAAGARLASALSGDGSSSSDSNYQTQRREVGRTSGESSFKTNARVGDYRSRELKDAQLQRKAFQQNESIIKSLKTISEGEEKNITLRDGNSIDIGYGLATKIINIYESMNKNNKQTMANMLEENVDNFKKIGQFAIDNGK